MTIENIDVECAIAYQLFVFAAERILKVIADNLSELNIEVGDICLLNLD